MSSSSASRSSASLPNGKPIDPITRTALRYTISPREYELLHQYLLTRAPKPVQKRALSPGSFDKKVHRDATAKNGDGEKSAAVGGASNDNVAAIRAALRVFVAVYVGFKGWDVVMGKLAARRVDVKAAPAGVRHKNVRLALSFSSILLFHRLLHRFFRRLRTALLEDDDAGAGAFRKRNPRVAKLLTSTYTPALGAALSGLCLGLSPKDQLRTTIAIYLFTRSLEFAYNAAEENGYLWKKDGKNGKESRPWWFGSWMIMPFACGQLLHAFVFDRDCFPESYGRFILKRSPEYIQTRPPTYPADRKWPGTFVIVDALAELSHLRWPPFTSPILFPNKADILPPKLASMAPITGPAHPAIKHTSCAILHPSDPSCARNYLKFFLAAFPSTVRFITLIYGAFALLAYKSLLKAPLPFLNGLGERILRLSLFLTGAIGTSWMSICLFSHNLPRSTLPTQRWFLGGFLGGMWAFLARKKERGNFLYSARLSIDSLWKVGSKRGWWKGVKGGDVLLFTASLALLDLVYERYPGAVRGAMIRKGLGVLRNEGFTDRAVGTKMDEEMVERQEAEEDVVGEKVKED